MRRGCPVFIVALAAFPFLDCGEGETLQETAVPDGGGAKPPAEGTLFVDGCPEEGKAAARKIADPRMKMAGPDALGRAGDYLLMNDRAAFIIEGVEQVNTYYYYGGIPIDAVALDGCAQASPERFEELGIVVGRLNVAQFANSILRAFRGDAVTIVNDGSDGGAAVVRVTGADDYFWLVEMELIRLARESNIIKPRTSPMGFKISVDYVLPPDSNVLRIEVTFQNTADKPQDFLTGIVLFFGDTTTLRYYYQNTLGVSGFDLKYGVPWLAATDGDGAWAASIGKANMATVNVSGVDAFIDANQAMGSPTKLGAAGGPGDTTTVSYFLGVGGTDSNSAVRHLREVNGEPMPGMRYELVDLAGGVHDALTGDPQAGALVELQAPDGRGEWHTMDSFHSGADGRFGGRIADFGSRGPPYRLAASVPGRPSPEPVPLDLKANAPVEIEIEPGGALHYDLRDGDGAAIPAKILLWQNGQVVRRIFGKNGADSLDVAPGEYQVSVTRGYEYTTYEGGLRIEPGKTALLAVVLDRAVDTTGFLSMDGHVHAGPSTDNRISIPERIATVAAEGLEVVVGTDHEYVSDWGFAVRETGLGDWVAAVTGQEVTATLPEHSNIYPVEPRFDVDARGGYVKWFGMDIALLFAAEHDRGAGIVALNHPRNGCNYLCKIEYDRLTGTAGLKDPAALGYAPGAALWSWDFNVVEYMNGPQRVFVEAGKENETGIFDDWMSFLNLGRRITALGNSDAHDYEIPGTPRNYFASPTDAPGKFNEADLVDAVLGGRVVVSTGAFARVEVNGAAGMGDTITDNDGQVDLSVHIEAIPEIDVSYFKVYVNCDQVLNLPTTAPAAVVKFDGKISVPVERDAHVVVLGFGKNDMPPGLARIDPRAVPRFTTNPVYVDRDGNGVFDPPGGKTCSYDLKAPGE